MPETSRRALVFHHGCAITEHERNRYRVYLREQGWELTDVVEEADLVVLTTCGASEKLEGEAADLASRISNRLKPGAKFLIGGCLPDINRAALEGAAPGARLFSSARDTSALEEAAGGGPLDRVRYDGDTASAGGAELPEDLRPIYEYLEALDRRFGGTSFRDCLRYAEERIYRAPWERVCEVKIAEGCAWNCSYCVVKRARGEIRSRPKDEIVEAFRSGLGRGFSRFRLIADEAGDYGIDRGEDLALLLGDMLRAGGDRDYEIGIWYIAPVNLVRMFDRLLPIFRSGRVHQFLSAVQSADREILRAMRRPTDVGRWFEAMERVRDDCPEIFLGTHLIAGFPGESEEAFERTVDLARRLRVDMLSAVAFSGRPGTLAAGMPGQVPMPVRLERVGSPHHRDVLAAIGRIAIDDGGAFETGGDLFGHLLEAARGSS